MSLSDNIQSNLIPFLRQAKILEYYQILKSNNNESKLVKFKGTRVIYLNLSNHSIGNVPSSIKNFEYLEVLNLKQCSLTDLPDEIGELSNLRVLSLQDNHLTELPSSIFSLPNLTNLNLKNAGDISSIAGDIMKDCVALEKINLSHINLQEINDNFVIPKNLKYLDLSNNSLGGVEFLNTENLVLEQIDLNTNNLSSFPINLEHFTSLKILYLEKNSIRKIDPQVVSLINLSALDLSYNAIQTLNEELYTLKELIFLNLEFNQIQEISSDINHLINLEELWLGNNQIGKIPEEIGMLYNLKILRLNNNQLILLPMNFLNLRLEELNLLGNKLPNPFNFVCPDKETTQDFFDKLHASLHEETSPVHVDGSLKEISKVHIFLESGEALLTYNGLTNTITDMDLQLAGVFQIAMNIIDTEGKSFIPIKDKDDRTIQITVYQGVGFGFDFLGLYTSIELHNDLYLKTAVASFVHEYGELLRNGIVSLAKEQVSSSFQAYFGEI